MCAFGCHLRLAYFCERGEGAQSSGNPPADECLARTFRERTEMVQGTGSILPFRRGGFGSATTWGNLYYCGACLSNGMQTRRPCAWPPIPSGNLSSGVHSCLCPRGNHAGKPYGVPGSGCGGHRRDVVRHAGRWLGGLLVINYGSLLRYRRAYLLVAHSFSQLPLRRGFGRGKKTARDRRRSQFPLAIFHHFSRIPENSPDT